MPVISIVSGVWVLVIVVPEIFASYPETFSSVTVYVITSPALYFATFLNSYFQSFAFVAVVVATFVPLANKFTVIDSGRFPSWSLLSFHTLVPVTSIVSGVCVFVIVVPSTIVVYPATFVFSATVYLIAYNSSPSWLTAYLYKSLNSYVQLAPATVVSDITSLFAFNTTIIELGLFPSWLLASFHTFNPDTSIFSRGVIFNVTVDVLL